MLTKVVGHDMPSRDSIELDTLDLRPTVPRLLVTAAVLLYALPNLVYQMPFQCLLVLLPWLLLRCCNAATIIVPFILGVLQTNAPTKATRRETNDPQYIRKQLTGSAEPVQLVLQGTSTWLFT